MQEDYENVTSPAAEQGTRVHVLLHHLLTDKPLPDKVDREELARAQYAFELVMGLIKSHLYRGTSVKLHTEEKVHLNDNPELRGTLDIAILVEKRTEWASKLITDVYVIDYKDGNVPVQVTDNKQVEYYAAAFVNELEGYHEIDRDNTKFHIGIIQPRVAEGIQWDKVRYYWHLAAVRTNIEEEVDICETRPFTKAGEWCKYCLASGACKANAERLMELVGVDINV
jgi:hypothetical protein